MVKIITDEDLKKLPEHNRNRILDTRAKYGINKWWESEDLRIIGYYQLKEDILITDFSKYHKGLELLLGRPVWTHEFALNQTGLIEEAEKAFALMQAGESTETTPEYKARKAVESMEMLLDFAEKNGKEVIIVALSEGEERKEPEGAFF